MISYQLLQNPGGLERYEKLFSLNFKNSIQIERQHRTTPIISQDDSTNPMSVDIETSDKLIILLIWNLQ